MQGRRDFRNGDGEINMNCNCLDEIQRLLDAGQEVHMIVEEQEAILDAFETDEPFIGLRPARTNVSDDYIEVDDGRKTHYICPERIVYFTPAIEFPD